MKHLCPTLSKSKPQNFHSQVIYLQPLKWIGHMHFCNPEMYLKASWNSIKFFSELISFWLPLLFSFWAAREFPNPGLI